MSKLTTYSFFTHFLIMNKTDKHDIDKLNRLIKQAIDIYKNKIPLHEYIGFEYDQVTPEQCKISFKNKSELTGNYIQNILHGGITATALDIAGGLIVSANVFNKYLDMPEDDVAKKIYKIGTIDLRIDYVRPGRGNSFYVTSKLLRSGNRVAVVRMELHCDDGTLVALGTGTYITG